MRKYVQRNYICPNYLICEERTTCHDAKRHFRNEFSGCSAGWVCGIDSAHGVLGHKWRRKPECIHLPRRARKEDNG